MNVWEKIAVGLMVGLLLAIVAWALNCRETRVVPVPVPMPAPDVKPVEPKAPHPWWRPWKEEVLSA